MKPPKLIIKLVQSKNCINTSISFIIIWLILGCLDSFYFRVNTELEQETLSILGIKLNKYWINSELLDSDQKFIPWIHDWIGHWLALFTVIAASTLDVTTKNLARITENASTQIEHLIEKKFWKRFLLLTFILAFFTFKNYSIVSNESKNIIWSYQISWMLSLFISFFYYYIVIFSIWLALYSHLTYINFIVKNVEKISVFEILHKEGMFGLRVIGKSILVDVLILSILLFPVLYIQVVQKNDFTFGSFLSAFVVLFLFWNICISPLLQLNQILSEKKLNSYKVINNRVQIVRIELETTEQESEKNKLRLKLADLEKNEKFIASLKTVPMTNQEIFIGILILIGLFAQITFGLIYYLF